jgi:hypothetical protein
MFFLEFSINHFHNLGKNIIGSTFRGKKGLAAHSGKKYGWQHILGKINMIGSSFCEKKNMIATHIEN